MRRRRFLLRTARVAGAVGAAGATAFGLGGCGSGDDGKLRLLAASYGKSVGSSIDDQWDDLIAAFEKKHPDITVDLELVPFAKIDQTLADRVAAGRAPDLAQGNVFARYAADGRLYSAAELFPIPVQADFIPSFAEAGEVHHAQYGAPFLASTPRLFYNKGLLRKAGVDGPPGSWAELRETASALRGAGVKTPYGLQFGPEAAEDEALAWMLAAGGGYASTAGYDFPRTANVHALTWLKTELVAEGLAGSDPRTFNRTDAYAHFLRGEVGMLLAHPVLLKAADHARIPYGHADFPREHGGAAPPVGISDWLMAFKSGGRRKACGAFLTFLYGEKSARVYAGGQGALPVTVSASHALRTDSRQRPLWKFIDQMPDARFHPVGRESWPRVRAAIRREAAGAVVRGGDPEGVLQGLQNAADDAESASRAS